LDGVIPADLREKTVKNWIYFATEEKASLASTLETVLRWHFLWRSAFNKNGAQIANVGSIKAGDQIVLAWRHSGVVRTAYLRCQVAPPWSPFAPGLVIDKLAGPSARALISAGYPMNSAGEVEDIRLDDIQECCFPINGEYGGNNALHKLATEDVAQLSTASTIPPEAFTKAVKGSLKRVSTKEAPAPVAPAPSSAGVEKLEIKATTDERAFDAYVMVDWSSSSSPVTGNDSIWIASGAWSGGTFTAVAPRNIGTRAQTIKELQEQVERWRDEGKRVLVGFDFAFGYPAGFAYALGLASGSGAWKALHEHFASRVTDSPLNVHNRDAFADECNRKIGAPGPFWGCTASAITPSLTQQRIGMFQFPHHKLEEWRTTDLAAARRVTTQSVWKLSCGVSVGGQTILGIKYLDELARAVRGHRWPFEGWTTPTGPAIWFAEIFPSLVQHPEWAVDYENRRDRTQVQSCLREAAERDAGGKLRGDFAKPSTLDPATLARIEGEEGWILWVEPISIPSS
jgi:precorrin-8X/cobalt-precorrin-8 methylmutase